jgi:hypothetical protein
MEEEDSHSQRRAVPRSTATGNDCQKKGGAAEARPLGDEVGTEEL